MNAEICIEDDGRLTFWTDCTFQRKCSLTSRILTLAWNSCLITQVLFSTQKIPANLQEHALTKLKS